MIFGFAGNENGVYHFDGQDMRLLTTEDGLCNVQVISIQEDQYGNLYFDADNCVSKFDGQSFTTLEVTNNGILRNEWVLQPNDLWFRMGWSKKGPFRYDGENLYALEFPKTAQVDSFYARYPDVSFSPYDVYTHYEDQHGNRWFGTSSLGVCRFDGETISWLYEEHLTTTPEGGAFGFRSILQDKNGDFWINNSRYRFQIQPTSTIKDETLMIDYTREDGVGGINEQFETEYPYFLSIAEDDNSHLWMVTYDDGVWRYDGQTLVQYPVKKEGKTVLLFSIYKDKEGGLWLGTHEEGVYKFDGKGFEPFQPGKK